MAFQNNTIGCVGAGFVGSAVIEGMKHVVDVKVFDKNKTVHGSVMTLREVAGAAEVIFVCVPTPMRADGSCDTSIVASVIHELDTFGLGNIAVIKSTVPPGTTEALHRECKGLKGVVFSPEFLTEANYLEDFKNQDRIILGGNVKCNNVVRDIFRRAFPNVPILKTSSENAELIKYVTNCFLATKVSFANEIYQICSKLYEKGANVDYDRVIELATLDKRLGSSHWKVPGPMPADGPKEDFVDENGTLRKGVGGKLLPGYSGSCLVKDINALMSLARALDVNPLVLNGAWCKNLEVRPERDWEYLKGRAIVTSDKKNK